ncbi:MAG: TadE family protein, partial [Gemmataceae bacterium]
MFLFGIFEYSRFLFMLQTTTNAARDGARYASVNVSRPTNFTDTPYFDGIKTHMPIKAFVDDKMGNARNQLVGYTVTVFACDSAKLAQNPPVIDTKPNAIGWNDAAFGERVAVRVTGTYTPFLPNLLLMATSIPVNITVTMGSEG